MLEKMIIIMVAEEEILLLLQNKQMHQEIQIINLKQMQVNFYMV